MTKPLRAALIAVAALATLALSACVEDRQMTRSEPVAAAPGATRPPANQAERNCVQAVARQLGGDVRASDIWEISSEFSQAGTSVRVHVPRPPGPASSIGMAA